MARAAVLSALLIASSACEDINWPFHRARSSAGVPADANGGASSSECADIQAQIKDNQEARREAPTTSVNPDIVSASEGKADKHIDDLQRRYDELDCPSAESANRPGRQPPLQPAPGAVNR